MATEDTNHERQLAEALETLLAAADLNVGELEPETVAAIKGARETLDTVRGGSATAPAAGPHKPLK